MVSNINDTVWDGKVLDYKTQKLIAIGITASRADPRATKKQMRSAIEVLGITKEEIVDVLRVVLLTSGMPAFSKSLQILNSVVASIATIKISNLNAGNYNVDVKYPCSSIAFPRYCSEVPF